METLYTHLQKINAYINLQDTIYLSYDLLSTGMR